MTRSAAKRKSIGDDLPLADAGDARGGGAIASLLFTAYPLMLLAGFAVFRLPGAMPRGNEMPADRALFAVVSAATLTGFQQSTPLDNYGLSGQICVTLLTAGGAIFGLIVGGLGLVRLLRLPMSPARIIRATLIGYPATVLIASGLLIDRNVSLMEAISQASAAFANCGVALGRLPGALDWRTHLVLLPLMLLGGLSIPVLLDLLDAILLRRRASVHTWTVLSLTAGAYLIGLMLLAPWAHIARDEFAVMAQGSIWAIDSRTCGLPILNISSLSRVAQWLLIVMMILGTTPAGAAGGMKLTTLYHLWRGGRRTLRRETGLRISGIAAIWASVYLILVFATLLGLLAFAPEIPGDRLVFLAASAVGNVGLSHDPVSIAGGGLMVLSGAMLLGRIAPLLVLWWAATTVDDADVGVG